MAQPINPGRLILGTLLAPMIGAFSVIIAGTILDRGFFDDPLGYLQFVGTVGGIVTLLIGLPTMLVIGLPIHGWLCHNNQRHWTRYAGYGAMAGLVPALTFGLFDEAMSFPMFLIGAAGGCLTALLFHLIRGPHLALTEPANPTT